MKENAHTDFVPIFNDESEILILGSFPSVISRQINFYYGNKQNRFWTILSILFNEAFPTTTNEKINLLHKHHIALWDVVSKCQIDGSSDQSIKNVVVNDLSVILNNAPIKKIFVNGKKAYELLKKYVLPNFSDNEIYKNIHVLPSTSPANAKCSLDNLLDKWKIILLPFN